ncbi:hypothetical protein COO60DRAFT_1175694 [Scenedesmus sp. NREL 46B-D3]|nr:hypothetical protein COO60DRAFT_1175694 [Scenedesmus sp. NREL 46B-D3]
MLIDSAQPVSRQQQGRWQPALAVLTNGDLEAAASLQLRAPSLAAAAAEAEVPSTSPTNTAGAGAGISSGEPAAAGPAVPAAPRKLYVREYDMGLLLREYPLTAEEIKMIFGFLWPKNKVRQRVQRALRRGPRMQKKLGEVVYKGHYSYSLMLELQLGIRYSVGRALRPRGSSALSSSSAVSMLRTSFGLAALRPRWSVGAAAGGVGCVFGGRTKDDVDEQRQQQQQRGARDTAVAAADEDVSELCAQDFEEKLAVFFPSSGSSTTPAHPSMDFMWRDYCPRVFRRLRKAAGIDEADYMLSLAGAQALRQLNSPGKSGSMFLLSEDERFLVKTMRKSEMSVLLGMLEQYSLHMERHPNTLITRFFGVHKVTPAHGRSVRFVVMANIFVTDCRSTGGTTSRAARTAARWACRGAPGLLRATPMCLQGPRRGHAHRAGAARARGADAAAGGRQRPAEARGRHGLLAAAGRALPRAQLHAHVPGACALAVAGRPGPAAGEPAAGRHRGEHGARLRPDVRAGVLPAGRAVRHGRCRRAGRCCGAKHEVDDV